MKVYEIIKKPQLNYRGNYEEKYLLKTKIFGIPFYKVGDDNILSVLLGVVLAFGTLLLPFLFFELPFINIIELSITVSILWYVWHFTAIRKFDNEYDIKKLIEFKIKNSIKKQNNIVVRYIQRGNSVEVNKFIE